MLSNEEILEQIKILEADAFRSLRSGKCPLTVFCGDCVIYNKSVSACNFKSINDKNGIKKIIEDYKFKINLDLI